MAHILFGDYTSGNCVKALLAAEAAGIDYRWVAVNTSVPGAPRHAEVVALNPSGQVPVLRLPDGRGLGQSNAIALFLLRDTAFVPSDPFDRAKMHEWMFWEQYSHEPNIAVVRSSVIYRGTALADRDADKVARGEAALDTMEQYLANREWFAADAPSAADIALFAYTRVAHEGGFDLSTRPAIGAWLARCEQAFERGIAALDRLASQAG